MYNSINIVRFWANTNIVLMLTLKVSEFYHYIKNVLFKSIILKPRATHQGIWKYIYKKDFC